MPTLSSVEELPELVRRQAERLVRHQPVTWARLELAAEGLRLRGREGELLARLVYRHAEGCWVPLGPDGGKLLHIPAHRNLGRVIESVCEDPYAWFFE